MPHAVVIPVGELVAEWTAYAKVSRNGADYIQFRNEEGDARMSLRSDLRPPDGWLEAVGFSHADLTEWGTLLSEENPGLTLAEARAFAALP